MTEVIDSNESVVNRYRYTPFGQSMVKNESVHNPYQYTGRRYDEERGNYYYRARIYDQQQSRFLSNDPAEQGANLYAYVGGNPVNRRDPSGEGGIPIGGIGLGMRFVDGCAPGRKPGGIDIGHGTIGRPTETRNDNVGERRVGTLEHSQNWLRAREIEEPIERIGLSI